MKINELLNLDSSYTKDEKKIILSFLLKCNKNDLYLKDNISLRVINKYKNLIMEKIPVQYLLQNANFLGTDFFVNQDVLIPRFETEQLVIDTNELIIKYLDGKADIIDIGTGSGAIAISLKKLNNNYNVSATDVSEKALRVARKNSMRLNTYIKIFKRDMLNNITGKYDVLISNPPYLYKDGKIDNKVLEYEPHLALFGGINFYERILSKAKDILNEKSIIALEIGYDEKEDINKIVKKYFKEAKVIFKKDLNNYDRYVYILNNIE